VVVEDGMDVAGSDDDDLFLQDDGDGDSAESTDAEDSDGLPKGSPENKRGVPKLPPGLQVIRKQRRFRKAYGGPSISAPDLSESAGK